MKAVVQTRYGPPDVLALRDVADPRIADGAVLVRVEAASVNPADWHFMRGEPYLARLQAGLRRPKWPVLGCDLAGRVEAVGSGVGEFQVGDEVFGCSFMRGFGAFAESAAVTPEVLERKPRNLSFKEAAALPLAALTALQALRDQAELEDGHRVLIIGASGGVGTNAVQIARARGAEVTGVCSARNIEFVRSIGATHVVDYSKTSFLRQGRRYDVILQLAGSHSPSELRQVLAPGGTIVLSSGDSKRRWIGPMDRVLRAALISLFVDERLTSFTVSPNRDDLAAIRALAESGDLVPVVGRTYPLSDLPDAIRQVEAGHSRGKVVIEVRPAAVS